MQQGITPLIPTSNLQMTAFSDCYVLSEVAPAWHVLAAVQALGSRFLAEGILTRGAVVQGSAYHNGRVLFGPGIVDAYKLESEVAKYPRILVTDGRSAEGSLGLPRRSLERGTLEERCRRVLVC